MSRAITRRGLVTGACIASPLARALGAGSSEEESPTRLGSALRLRQRAAALQNARPLAPIPANGDETNFPDRIGCFAKGLSQNDFGEVRPAAYDALLAALKSGKYAAFDRVPRAGGRKLSNPVAAFAFHLEGGDSHQFGSPLAPSITSEAAAWETSELYWQSLCREVPFERYNSTALVGQAAEHLGVTPATIFRGSSSGDLSGPYVSQFLIKPIPYGSGRMEQRYRVPIPGCDFLTSVSEWSQIQNGLPPWREATYDPILRYIRNGHDLAEYVHYDFPYQAYLNAALILYDSGPRTILNCNPFKNPANPYRRSTRQEGFVTFGQAEITDWLARVTTSALKAAYFQKWMVHRRVRPEALGGLVHFTRAGRRKYPVHASLLSSPAVDATFALNGTYLLPQGYPEACPLHPSYPSGHAAIGGACSIILKACFDGSMLLPGCVRVNPDGTALLPFPEYAPTIGAEIDKLVFNIAMGRDWAGIHYRSDAVSGLRLGEDVAISVLQDLVSTYAEDFAGFSLTRLDGTRIRIIPQA
jgi:membrane-associated phospholipid phosphatase